ncbi:MAG TPA: HEAT repeat domain-containing protein [Pirellulaceae bacterium]|nr:HEAT repeat domain-containing protein [Pirellulaceae bacterium]HMO91634.1 HEAT repeat domain-containing protein [Pirellulaceae bacterium]HMP68331.1 HEAT repeat domain-containing protein [Pirellulaceae bacterium]
MVSVIRTACYLMLFTMAIGLVGCAKGPLWKTGKLNPWAIKQLQEEEQIAETIFSKRKRFRETVNTAKRSSPQVQEEVAERLAEVALTDSVLLMRLEAVNLLSELNTPTSVKTLESASLDRAPDVRLAAIRGLRTLANPSSAAVMAQLSERDSELDVRIAATQALEAFQGTIVLQSLERSLTDRNPAIQTAAMDALPKVTGQELPRDVNQWLSFLKDSSGNPGSVSHAPSQLNLK